MNKKTGYSFDASTLDEFLHAVGNDAFRMAELATKNTVDAMDVLELTVKAWVKKHRHKPFDQWLFQFYKTLYLHLSDFERRQIAGHRRLNSRTESICLQDIDPTEKSRRSPADIRRAEFNKALVAVLGHLPLPQQQAFLLSEWQRFTVEEIALMLAEEPLVIAHRYASAVTGLQDALEPLMEGDAALMTHVIAALQESAADISYAQDYQLRHIRLQALDQVNAKPILKWVLLSGAMSLCLFVFWWLQIPDQIQTQSTFYSDESLTATYPQAWQESRELLGNIDFFSWLSVQEKLPINQKVPDSVAVAILNATGTRSQEQKLQLRQRFTLWQVLQPEQKASLRADFASFQQFSAGFQQTLRQCQAIYGQLPEDEQQALRLQWQALTVDDRAQLQIAINKFRTQQQ